MSGWSDVSLLEALKGSARPQQTLSLNFTAPDIILLSDYNNLQIYYNH